ncbi:hypothetical protein PILCRDRAFT_93717 [Piloderma croceum F 1598]|uniref:Uncharacterized protein n=1 Tax=Piloderma croceum (strain F 1598) TaxID=765440 RepID=A0A0C3EUQ6_PILCF|nr:hypothetical protein PILCRDRAFT_93717 [Piloderma croceum F 1598]
MLIVMGAWAIVKEKETNRLRIETIIAILFTHIVLPSPILVWRQLKCTTVTIAFEQPHIASASVNTSLSSPVAQHSESTEAPAPASVLPPMTAASTGPSTAPPDILMAFNVPTMPDVVTSVHIINLCEQDWSTANLGGSTSDFSVYWQSIKDTAEEKASGLPLWTQLVPNLCEVDAMLTAIFRPFNIGFACPLVLAMSQQLLSVPQYPSMQAT